MALKLNERYPGRFNSPTPQYPQGSFKNRTAPGAKDGSYLEQDWANDQLAFFSSLLENASLTPNGKVDVVGGSQYYNALSSLFISGTVPISKGGTGATTASTARIQLGLGDAAQKTVGIGTNQIPDMNSFGSSKGSNGWMKLPSGFIFQWGPTDAGSTTREVTFPIPFPTAVVLVNHFDASWVTQTNGARWGATNRTVTGFTGRTDTAGEGGQYLALGY